MEWILTAVAEKVGCSVDDICGGGGGRRVTAARYSVVVLARQMTRLRMQELARILGRDPATLCNGVARRLERPNAQWQELVEGVRHYLTVEKEMEVSDPF